MGGGDIVNVLVVIQRPDRTAKARRPFDCAIGHFHGQQRPQIIAIAALNLQQFFNYHSGHSGFRQVRRAAGFLFVHPNFNFERLNVHWMTPGGVVRC